MVKSLRKVWSYLVKIYKICKKFSKSHHLFIPPIIFSTLNDGFSTFSVKNFIYTDPAFKSQGDYDV